MGSRSGVGHASGIAATQKISYCESFYYYYFLLLNVHISPKGLKEGRKKKKKEIVKRILVCCRECSRLMVGFHDKAATGKLTGVHRKYCTSKFGYTAKCEPAKFL